MRGTIFVLALATAVSIFVLALATAVALRAAYAGRKAEAPSVKSLLTTEEQACQLWGEIYFWIATERDKGNPLTVTVNNARIRAVKYAPNDPPTAARIREHMMKAVQMVYALSNINPAGVRYIMEIDCMPRFQADATATDAARPWR